MNRRLMIEVTEEEYEIIKKGIKISDMKTEDLIYEIISRCPDKKAIDGDILSGTASIVGSIELPDDGKEFRFKLENCSMPKLFPFPTSADPLKRGTFEIRDNISAQQISGNEELRRHLVMGEYPRGKRK